jgi:hypothetical protein
MTLTSAGLLVGLSVQQRQIKQLELEVAQQNVENCRSWSLYSGELEEENGKLNDELQDARERAQWAERLHSRESLLNLTLNKTLINERLQRIGMTERAHRFESRLSMIERSVELPAGTRKAARELMQAQRRP